MIVITLSACSVVRRVNETQGHNCRHPPSMGHELGLAHGSDLINGSGLTQGHGLLTSKLDSRALLDLPI